MKLKCFGALVFIWFGYFPLEAQKTNLLELIQNRYKQIESFQGKFIQQNFNIRNKKLRTATGKVSYLRPGKMRWDYNKPNEQLLVTDGVMLWLYDPLLDNVTIQPLKKITQGTPLAFLLGAGDLNKDFTQRPITQSIVQDPSVLTVELKPKKSIAALDFIQLVVDPYSYDFKKIILVDLQGNHRIISFEELQYNKKLEVEQFRFEIPPGMEVINPNQ